MEDKKNTMIRIQGSLFSHTFYIRKQCHKHFTPVMPSGIVWKVIMQLFRCEVKLILQWWLAFTNYKSSIVPCVNWNISKCSEHYKIVLWAWLFPIFFSDYLQFLSSSFKYLLQTASSCAQFGSDRVVRTHSLWCHAPYDFGFIFKQYSVNCNSASYKALISSSIASSFL